MQVHLIDDDLELSRALARRLQLDGWIVSAFCSATAYLEVADQLEEGCILLDIHLPDVSGLDVLEQIGRRRPCSPVVMISGTAEVDHAVRAFRGGALHLIRKPFRHEELTAVLREAAQERDRRRAAKRREEAAQEVRLSRRERQVLAAVARGLQSKQIAFELGISLRTVDLHRGHALAKLGARNSSQAVAKARALGLIPEEPLALVA
jgi:two-component system response regulator FixJ